VLCDHVAKEGEAVCLHGSCRWHDAELRGRLAFVHERRPWLGPRRRMVISRWHCLPGTEIRLPPKFGQAIVFGTFASVAHGTGFLTGADGSRLLALSSLSSWLDESSIAIAPRLLVSCVRERGPIIGTAPWVPAQAMAT
jgi:hypothetical protein